MNYDLYSNWKFLILQLLIAFAIVPIIIWISKLSPDKNMDTEIHFLEDIKHFKK